MAATKTTSTSPLVDLLFENAAAGLCLVAPDGSILRANAEWLRSTGFGPDVIGEDVVELFPGARDMAAALHARARAGHHVEVPRHALRVNGRETWWEGSVDPVPMEGGTGLLITAREVSGSTFAGDGHAAELLELGDPFCELDREFRVIRVNAAHERVNGHRREQILGRTHWEVWPETADPTSLYWREYHRCVEERVPVQFDAHYAPLDVWTSVSAYPTAQGGIAIFWRDDTARKRAEAALRDSEQRFRALFTNMTDAFAVGELVRGPDGAPRDFIFVEMNDAFERHTGIERARTLNKPFSEVAPEIERYWLDMYVAVVGDGGARRLTNYNRDTRRHYDVYCYRPEPGRFAIIFSDITDQKRAEAALRESEARLRLALDAAKFGTFDLDVATGAIVWDDVKMRMWGISKREDFRYPAVLDRIHPEDRSRVTTEVEAALRTGEYESEYRVTWPDGSVHWLYARARVEFDEGTPARMIGVELDVTDRKLAEQALADANERLRDAARRKDEFLGMLSHELRNPLAPIRNALYILDRAEPGGQQAHRAKEVANRQVAHLARLVDDLLDVTRIARGKVELRRADRDLSALAQRTAEDHRALLQERGLELVVDVPAHPVLVNGDEVRLAQVLGNLLANAAKFTPAGGTVTLSITADARDAVINVRDTGPGIDPALIETIFDPFTQAKQTLERSEGGLGLGLALVKGLVALHGGEVVARNAGAIGGAEFVVTLPLVRRPADPAPGADDVAPSSGVARRRVLVIDDNRDAAETLAQLVEMLGHGAQVAYDGPGALRSAREQVPDLVLCDIGLPGMDGYEVARELRRLSPSHVRIIAVSGYAQPEDVARAIAAGFDGHVAKPPDPAQLESLLGR